MSSYAEFSAKKVAAACKATLEDCKKNVDAQREARIAEIMNKKRWFFSPYTRDEAIRIMKSCPPESIVISEWDEYDYYESGIRKRTNELLALAEAAPRGEDRVMLDAKDVFMLRSYLK